jgi:energy-coupling factor transporter ATP-binding protein EcfA2
MLLRKVKVKDFLSVKGECELPIDRRATVLLGANDHGKSNLLRALEHLNPESPIKEEEQNWDSRETRLDFIFGLTDKELESFKVVRKTLEEKELAELKKIKANQSDEEPEEDDPKKAEKALANVAPVPPVVSPLESLLSQQRATPTISKAPPPPPDALGVMSDLDSIREDLKVVRSILDSASVTLTRNGVDTPISVFGWDVDLLEEETQSVLKPIIPRVELFKAFSGELQDSVTAKEIESPDSEFLQGIFFYAGIDPRTCSNLFEHTDETDKTLEDASARLDRELRGLWAQGVDLDLHFQLKHKGESIELYARDPAVIRRQTRMSNRSAGVTQFFRLSMVLHARRKKNPANSYIYLFDEPGVLLHPKGQKDLLAVFEQLAGETQIVYATHSLFMLNQNYPERHRLISKNRESTIVDTKPYRANWKYAVDALGVRLTANILFSPNILLVEGDSDPIYLYDLLRVLNHLGEIDADANLVGIMSYGDLPNLRFLLQTFNDESKERPLSVLFEGDSQGRDYQKAVDQLCKRIQATQHTLSAGSAIEDYCLYPELFLQAVEETIKSSFEAMSKPVPPDLKDQVGKSWEVYQTTRVRPSAAKSPKGASPKVPAVKSAIDGPAEGEKERAFVNAGKWFKVLSKEVLGDSSGGASKVALARNYVFLCRDNPVEDKLDAKRVREAKSLLEPIIKSLKIPSMKAKKTIAT